MSRPLVVTLTLPSGDFFEDVGGRGGPDERFGFGIVLLEIGFDCGLEFGDAAEDAAADRPNDLRNAGSLRPQQRDPRPPNQFSGVFRPATQFSSRARSSRRQPNA